MAEPIDLSTPLGRQRARKSLIWDDHGFLRVRFRNLHQISPEMWRANQPSPEHIEGYAREQGIRTIINLRGTSPKGYYLLEREACDRHGIDLVDYQVFSRDTPTRDAILGARDLFDRIRYPALMHCKSGADRAGIMSVLYMHFRLKQPIEQAVSQLSFQYLHIREGKTGVLDYLFDAYLKQGQAKGLSFEDWVAQDYDRERIKAEFLAGWRWRLNLDALLRRE